MIIGYRIDNHELGQIIFVRSVVAMPSYHVKRGMFLK